MKKELVSEKQVRRKIITSFSVFIIFFAMGISLWMWLRKQKMESEEVIPITLRKGLNANEQLFSTLLFNDQKLAKTYPKSAAVKRVRVNGDIGMSDDFEPETWKLQLVQSSGDTAYFTMDDIKSLPKTEIVFDFKCIEGWSQKTWWGGVKFSDFIKHYHLEKEADHPYVGMITPDKEYYVGIDMPSAMHPQTLLCYEMNGQPLPMNQGYPLRLIIPVKYGIKSIKRIGTIYFSNQRPPDYWFERGYDYYAGH